jgi:TRAP-type C4-dicarboxylate transport system permease small subunit
MRSLLRHAEEYVCVLLFLSMTLLGFVNVVVRYLTNYSLAATEELLTNGFLLLTVFGAAIAAKRREHLAVTLISGLLPRGGRKAVLYLTTALAAILLVAVIWFTVELTLNEYASGLRSYALGAPNWLYSIGLPIGFALVLVRFVQAAVEESRSPGGATERDGD